MRLLIQNKTVDFLVNYSRLINKKSFKKKDWNFNVTESLWHAVHRVQWNEEIKMHVKSISALLLTFNHKFKCKADELTKINRKAERKRNGREKNRINKNMNDAVNFWCSFAIGFLIQQLISCKIYIKFYHTYRFNWSWNSIV